MTQEGARASHAIHDLIIRKLRTDGNALTLLKYSDHLLFRIGLIQLRELPPGEITELRLRMESDELWFLLNGDCTFFLHDKRQNSPTVEAIQKHQATSPTMVLAPFGVAIGFSTEAGCQLLRVATHDHSHDDGGENIARPDS